MKGKGSNYLQGTFDLVRKHSFIIYSDIIDYKIVADTKILFLRCESYSIHLQKKVEIQYLQDST